MKSPPSSTVLVAVYHLTKSNTPDDLEISLCDFYVKDFLILYLISQGSWPISFSPKSYEFQAHKIS
jgi:hypothetical protein